MALVKCSHTMIGKKKFLCNDPISGAKTIIPLEQGVLCWISEELAKEYREVFTIVAQEAVKPADEEIDPGEDGDIESLDAPATDDGDKIPEPVVEDPLNWADEPSDADPKDLEPVEPSVETIDAYENDIALEEYGRKFSVELDRRKSLKNMKKALKKALEL